MKKIPLTRGLFALVDDSDYEFLSGWKWYADANGYAMRNVRDENGKRGKVRMHNAILPPPAGMLVDHINRNPLDNRRRNLRIVTPQVNGLNRRTLGVYWDTQRGMYRYSVWCGKKRHSGRTPSWDVAARKAKQIRLKLINTLLNPN